MESSWDIVVIGGGAAGFFAAIEAAKGEPRPRVAILEKSGKLLSKVAISGGGRCNVTHECPAPERLVLRYPRGGRSLRKAFNKFGTEDTKQWFQSKGVSLKVEEDGRVFPLSDQSRSIIDCLLHAAQRNKVEILRQKEVLSIRKTVAGPFDLRLTDEGMIRAKKLIIATGGHPKSKAYDWLRELKLKVREPIPSLFTFNVPDCDLSDLPGISVQMGNIRITGSKWMQEGPIMVTHWGFSAPAVIRLSAWAAEDLYAKDYNFEIKINWCAKQEHEVRDFFRYYKMNNPKQVISKNRQFELPVRLWVRLCEKAEISDTLRYHEVAKKQLNRLVHLLTSSEYQVKGKTTFKEEFVTCGGVELSEVDLETFQSKKIPGLYLAGEVLNVDGITGGFNFQHAWTSGYLAGTHAGLSLDN